MARRSNEQEATNDRSKIEVFYAKAEGSTQSLQDLMRALTTAIGRPVQVQVQAPPRMIQNTNPKGDGSTGPAEPDLFNQEQGAEEVVEPPNGEQSDAGQAGSTRRKRGEGNNRDRNSGLSIVKSLNLRPEGKESLKDFVAKKRPQSQMEHIAVYVYYLKSVLETENVGFSHIFTGFKETGERMPGDLPQTCRNAASQKGWIDTADQNDIKSTTHGDNLVSHDLPRSGGKGDNGKS